MKSSPSTLLCRQCFQCLFKTFHGGIDYTCADLPYARAAMGDACINDGRHVEATDLADINAKGDALEVERWYAKQGVTGDGDVIHLASIAQGISRRSPNKLYNGRRPCHGKGPYPAWLSNGSIANIR